MQLAEELKQKGNACFASGDVDGAVAAYQHAINCLTNDAIPDDRSGEQLDTTSEVGRMLAVLYSNLSNAYLSQHDYTGSWETAEEATRYDPIFVKAWVRYIHARRLDGYPFEAFVALLRRLRPLLRREAATSGGKTSEDVEASLSLPLYEVLGLSGVLPHIELHDFENGIGIVALQPIKPNEVILVEKRFETSFAEVQLNFRKNLTTTRIVSSFAQKVFAHQQRCSEEWKRFKKEFKGCWPRSPEDVPDDVRREISGTLRPELPPMEDRDFEELFLASTMCRYNCFHTGFFRACALANHSCMANAAMKLNSRGDSVTLIAVRPIAAGEFINVKYLSDAQFLMGVGKRREYLRSWLFWCDCSRCLSDRNGSSVSEHVQCGHCYRYTCVPLRGDGAESKEVDPLLSEVVSCSHCGLDCSWSPESCDGVERIIDSLKEATSCPSYYELQKWFLVNVRKVKELRVHPEHWLYRMLLYYFCFVVTPYIDDAFVGYQRVGWGAPNVGMLLLNFGFFSEYSLPSEGDCGTVRCNDPNTGNVTNNGSHDTDSIMDGKVLGDTLYILCLLWRLIEPFYPPYEGWAVHRAICYMVLFAHTHPKGEMVLPGSLTLQLLSKHGKYIGRNELSTWVAAYSRHKLPDSQKGILSVRQIKKAVEKV
ncbi:hypothetical protein, conserved [Trypanosoma brucei gambiense DAL972]|uniref:SET domain-containing protein n=1 Tax=Trypanosoma brucei gambiense (strain MHOM/CI/86/DAL972) TaxID=679716 RepID=D0A710_TRYB9|nr:hypothetical protein, conserved [Trypanosoma brucei gambiense DAL972]CBH17461.1 hypothetical protein, conserved [Trypanosoma brucei gambiense DAL972]|eukprot:XP_011779725.1 hypothetical protein, conserved [Trypanosoma brucei gambiense DAL972]